MDSKLSAACLFEKRSAALGDALLSALVSVAFHGLAYAMILYIISVGLSVTMGLMGFVNLAHGVFAMAGGYVTVTSMNSYGRAVPPSRLLAAFIVVALVSVVLERTALCTPLRRRRAGPGAVHHRPDLHVGRHRAPICGARCRSRCICPQHCSGQLDSRLPQLPDVPRRS